MRSEDVEDFLEQLAPLKFPKPSLPKGKPTPTNPIVVAGDFHFPFHDERVVDVLLQVIRDLKPSKVVLNGDLPDLFSVSKYLPDLTDRVTLQDERLAMHQFLVQLHEATNADLVETDANHSGSGREGRWRRYLSANAPALGQLPDILDLIGYEKVFYPQESWCRLRLVNHETLAPALIAIHGDIVRKNAAYSAKAMLEKYRVNLLHNHTHRMGATGYRVPGIGGQKAHQMRAYENGCCCRLEQGYGSTFDWQQGFGIVHLAGDEPEQFTVEQVLVHEGVAVVPSLGGTYRAT